MCGVAQSLQCWKLDRVLASPGPRGGRDAVNLTACLGMKLSCDCCFVLQRLLTGPKPNRPAVGKGWLDTHLEA